MIDQELRYSPFDPEIIADPYPVYRRLRDDAPLYWAAETRTWVLSRYDDVSAALADPATYSSASGVFPTPPGLDMTELFLPMLVMSDPPRHTQLRQLVSGAFTPHRVAALEQTVRAVVQELLDQTPSGDTWDFVSGFSGPLPAIVIADMLGVPREDHDLFRTWSTALVQSNPVRGEMGPGLDAAAALYEYFAAFLAERRLCPQDDLMSTLVRAEVDGRYLSEEELLGFCFMLLVAGHEASTNLLSNGAALLAEKPEIREQLQEDPDLVPLAVEELLRYDSPVQGIGRTLTGEVDLYGEQMKPGESVLLLFGSANRDDRAFPDAEVFDIGRRPEPPVALGHGIHFCLGAPLARMETQIALEALLGSPVFTWDADLAGAERLRSGPIRGFASLPVR
jgi:cytochrome P450